MEIEGAYSIFKDMKKLLLLLLLCRVAVAQDREATDPSVVHDYAIPSFRTESGIAEQYA
jgi:hypothetical protein